MAKAWQSTYGAAMTVEQGSKVWTVRGVPVDIQKAVSEAARARGMKLGAFVTAALWVAVEEAGEAAKGGTKTVGNSDLHATVDDLVKRVERLEQQGSTKAPRQNVPDGAPPARRTGGAKSAIPLDHVEEADRLQADGMSFARILAAKGWHYDRSALSVRVAKLRQARAAAT
jgi:hypothetical protein